MAPARHASRRLGNLAFLTFFAGYSAFALGVLALGAAAVVAARFPGFDDQLEDWALQESLWGRLAGRVADTAPRHVEPVGDLVIDYGFGLFNLSLAFFLVFLRRHERTARLLAVAMVGTAGVFNLQAHAVYEIVSPGALEAFTHDAFHVVAAVAYLLALLLFPDGRPVPRWRPVQLTLLYVAAVAAVTPLAFLVGDGSRTVGLIVVFGVLTPLVGVAGQAYRYRRSPTPIERQQARLLFWALSPALLVGVFALLVAAANSGAPVFEGRNVDPLPRPIFRLFQPVFSIIPIALFIGILRYRLWDIDKVISRTVVYSVLAGFVSAVYVGVVVGIGSLFGQAQTGNLALSIVATGIVAVAFQPVKERVQRFANRLVYGQRATPYEVLSEFSERVAETPATDELVARMARILAEGTGAQRADVWLRVGSELRPAACWPPGDEQRTPLPISGPQIPWIDDVTTAVAVRHHGELFGALSVTKPPNESLTPTEEKLLADLGRQAGLVLRNVQLTADLLARLDELRASRQRLVAAQDEARRRLERNLHDGAQQQLVALKVQLSLAEGMVEELGEQASPLLDMLRSLKAQMGDALENLRDLARGIYPPLLAAEGLPAALASQARKLGSVAAEVQVGNVGRYDQDAEAAVYFCTLEALQNITKYAGATRVAIRLDEEDGILTFEVSDDGCGFDTSATAHGAGSQNMIDRLEALGGQIRVSSAPGHGTTVTGRLPVVPRAPVPGR
ncbi:MAG: GAF domain-containing sensor histidine kinase [Actinobacteria bacterium]|nr:GAF domain-containing sensor histidine kinase [Actinomycetota bacterium]